MTPPPTPAALLEHACSADPARVLLTFFDDATGERTELSVATFANWVAKTANLCRDELGLDVGARVAIALPLHWQAAVWWQTCWVSGLVGLTVQPGGPVPPCEVAVLASEAAPDDLTPDEPTGAALPTSAAAEVVGLGLGPMGLPVPGRAVPASVTLDYDREVHAHGDRFSPPSGLTGDLDALVTAAGPRTAGQLGRLAAETGERWSLSAGDRALLASAYVDERALLGGLLVPLATGSAAVLCRHLDRADSATFRRRLDTEGVTALIGSTARVEPSRLRHLD